MLLVCCFLNEARHLPELLASVSVQRRHPDRLVLVDDGSSDGSGELAAVFAREHSFATALVRPRRPPDRDRLTGAPELRAFHWGLRQVDGQFELIGKLDGDLRLTPGTLAHLEHAFADDPVLGLAGPYLAEFDAEGRSVREPTPPQHVRGALKLYRRECLEAIEPIPEILGWDTIDELAARMHGWTTRSVAIADGDPLHLRPTGAHDGALRAYRRWGECAWGFGAHPLHVLGGAIRRTRERPRVLAGASYLAGWAAAGLRRAPRAPANVRAHGRGEQLASLRARLGRASDRPSAPAPPKP